MKTTIDIPEKELRDAMKFTGAKTKREAVVTAVEDFNRRKKMAELTKYFGTFTSLMTNEEIEGEDLKKMKKIFGDEFEFSHTDPLGTKAAKAAKLAKAAKRAAATPGKAK
jgi:hypothetical protein